MKMWVQRVTEARVEIGGEKVAEIGQGYLVLLGVTHTDTERDADALADRLVKLRIFEDENGKTNRSIEDVHGSVIVVSQFTLYADTAHGRRPGFSNAARPELALPLYERVVARLRAMLGAERVGTGRFGAEMKVSLVNDGPFSVELKSAVDPIEQSGQSNNQTIRTLLHACCGPCASACVPALKDLGREVTMLFANSNIDTREEFEKRKAEAEKLARHDGVEFVALPYDHAEWLREVAAGYENEPEKGKRCERCFRYNLAKTAAYAAAHGIASFTTSLTVSPHKVSSMIFSASDDPAFLKMDFKKKEGFKLSVKRTEELGLYRQSYCGCEFSKRQAK